MKPAGEVFNRYTAKSCAVLRCDRASADWMINRHYLGKWPGVVVSTFCLIFESRSVGLVVYALPPTQTYKRYGGLTWELARLWVDDTMPKNTESWLIAQTVKRIKKESPGVRALVSYADPSAGHQGVIYRAANWKPDGMTDDERKNPRFDYRVNGKMYSRKGHVPDGAVIERIPRVSKHRFFYRLEAS